MQMAWGYAAPLILEAAIQHRFFDVLDQGPLQAEQIASRTGTSPRGSRILLNALVGLEFLTRDASGRYALAPESAAFLVSTKPEFQGGLYRHVSRQLLPAWMGLSEIVRTGKPARSVNESEEADFFQKFVEDIFPMSYGAAKAFAQSLNGKPAKALDLASGSGVWGIALAEQFPSLRVTAVGWEGVLPVTRRVTEKHKVADRFTFLAGDILKADLGSGYNVATLGHILHSEGEQRSRELLKRVFAALAPGGTIAIQEFACNDDRTGPPVALIFAVNMLVNTDVGDTFTYPEMKSWLKEAGFIDARTLDTPGPSPLLLANKPA
jgi:ubiquinone/menaquinone biosynthesis C-methylase UbiE